MDNLLIKISKYLASTGNLDEDQEEVILYALQLIYSGIGGFIAIVILAWFFNVLPYALLGAVTNAYLRVRAGGAHASFPGSCFTIGAIIFTGLGLIAKYTPIPFLNQTFFILLLPSYLITLWVMLRYAPADTPNKPLSDERKKVLRGKTIRGHLFLFIIILALAIIQGLEYSFSSWFTINHLFAALLGIIWETFTITPTGYRLIDIFDRIMVKVFNHKTTANLD